MLTRPNLMYVLPACMGLTASALAGGGGDDATTATPIPGLPYADTGDTSLLTDQFDVVCPFSGSTSPDAWYGYVAAEGDVLNISVCDSAYDTKVYVLDADFNEIACNDDACGGRSGRNSPPRRSGPDRTSS